MRINRSAIWVILLLPVTGCHRYLVATPNVLHGRNPAAVFEQCPEGCKSPEAAVLYATDRALDGKRAPQTYGHGRANQLAFGVAQVGLHPHPTWMELTHDTTTGTRKRDYELQLASVTEHGRLRSSFGATSENGVIMKTSTLEAIQQREELTELLRGRLAQTAHKDVFIFVPGVNTTFDDNVFRAAEVWHFMGRVGVPIAYSWPAGLGGIRGYAYDRESGEFTVSHLRHFIQAVAECPDVERVHLVAHSRGCDVVISALRELNIGYRAQGKSTQKELKLENLILAAPDVDEDVFKQRFVSENLLQAARRTTVYASQYDRAIELSDLIFASRRRLGVFSVRDVNPKMRQMLAKLPNVQFIECKLSGLWIGHSYVFEHPAALSDLILVLRDRRDPGAENGRPLAHPGEGIWELTDDYLMRPK
jgi:esterase/lipase superfamily enzyme